MEQYEAPKVEVVADLQDLTLGSKNGYSLDATFPVHTPKKDLTFS